MSSGVAQAASEEWRTIPGFPDYRVNLHIVVALTFFGPRPPGADIRHLDGDPLNNAVSNLAYGSKSENLRDAVRHGTHAMTRKTHCPQGHPHAGSYVWRDRRFCRPCRAEQARRRRAARRARA